MVTGIVAAVTALLGIVGTVIAYKLNPKQQLWTKWDALILKQNQLLADRDSALATKDNDKLTKVTADLITLRASQQEILRKMGLVGA